MVTELLQWLQDCDHGYKTVTMVTGPVTMVAGLNGGASATTVNTNFMMKI
jgi:hypothetical protein